jgi:hypothetical protein
VQQALEVAVILLVDLPDQRLKDLLKAIAEYGARATFGNNRETIRLYKGEIFCNVPTDEQADRMLEPPEARP